MKQIERHIEQLIQFHRCTPTADALQALLDVARAAEAIRALNGVGYIEDDVWYELTDALDKLKEVVGDE